VPPVVELFPPVATVPPLGDELPPLPTMAPPVAVTTFPPVPTLPPVDSAVVPPVPALRPPVAFEPPVLGTVVLEPPRDSVPELGTPSFAAQPTIRMPHRTQFSRDIERTRVLLAGVANASDRYSRHRRQQSQFEPLSVTKKRGEVLPTPIFRWAVSDTERSGPIEAVSSLAGYGGAGNLRASDQMATQLGFAH
jgi:hypothetical protein